MKTTLRTRLCLLGLVLACTCEWISIGFFYSKVRADVWAWDVHAVEMQSATDCAESAFHRLANAIAVRGTPEQRAAILRAYGTAP